MAASPLISNSFPNTDSMNLAQLLKYAAGTQGGIFFYPSAGSEFRMEYHELLHKAQIRARAIQKVPGLQNNSVILLHFDQQLDNIEWFWAVTVAGYLPTLSTPLVNDPEQRKKHLSHLYDVLLDPIVFTKDSFLLEFKDVDGLRVHSIESVDARMPEAGFDDIEKLKIPNGRYMPVKPYQSPPTSIYEGDATSDSSASISGSVFSKVGSAGYLDTESSDHQASDTYKNIKKNVSFQNRCRIEYSSTYQYSSGFQPLCRSFEERKRHCCVDAHFWKHWKCQSSFPSTWPTAAIGQE